MTRWCCGRSPSRRSDRKKDLCDVNHVLHGLGYTVGSKFGEGTFTEVRAATHKKEPYPLAVKIIDRRSTEESRATVPSSFFEPELEIIAKMRHPNIIQLFQIVQIGRFVYIFMERAERGDLLEYIRTNGALTIPVAKRMFHELSDAVAHCHHNGISHRNIRCENVLLDSQMRIKLTDFGYACHCQDRYTGARILSSTFCGNPTYSAPEVLLRIPYEAKVADAWSLGVTLFIMVTSTMPFDESRLGMLLGNARTRQHYIADLISGHVPKECQLLIGQLMEPDVLVRLSVMKISENYWFRDSCRKSRGQRRSFHSFSPYVQSE